MKSTLLASDQIGRPECPVLGINISCQLLAKTYPLLTPPLSSPPDPPTTPPRSTRHEIHPIPLLRIHGAAALADPHLAGQVRAGCSAGAGGVGERRISAAAAASARAAAAPGPPTGLGLQRRPLRWAG